MARLKARVWWHAVLTDTPTRGRRAGRHKPLRYRTETGRLYVRRRGKWRRERLPWTALARLVRRMGAAALLTLGILAAGVLAVLTVTLAMWGLAELMSTL